MTEKPRIFVQIASYRDAECQHTVKDMFEKATHPERVFVGICWQVIPEEDGALFKIITRPDQVRINLVNAKESKGACWARRMTQTLWQGEEYTLQIDSHMRFEPGWDETMLAMLAACDSPKPMLTTYPPGYEPPDKIAGRWATSMSPGHFDDGGVLVSKAASYAEDQIIEKPMKAALLAGGFFFVPSSFIKEVPYDPYLYFTGEEIALAVRAYTHGWDLFHPNKAVIYHHYIDPERTGRKTHFGDNSEWWKLNNLSYQRVKHMLGTEISSDPEVLKELDIYGLGTARSLEDYQNFSGVNFKSKTISKNADAGIFGVGPEPDESGRPKIFVQIASYRDLECQHTVRDLFEKAAYPERINVAICQQFIQSEDKDLLQIPSPRPRQVKVIEVDARESKGANWARSLAQSLLEDEEYTLQIDSHMRFEAGWDETLINMLEKAGPMSAITLFPPSYTPPHALQEHQGLVTRIHIYHASYEDNAGILHLGANYIDKSDSRNGLYPTPLLIACVIFARSEMFLKVPIDPYLSFGGEEITYSARLWTHGYNIYQADKNFIYYQWVTEPNQAKSPYNADAHAQSNLIRVLHLLKLKPANKKNEALKNLTKYGLGKKRSLESFWKFIGVDIKNRVLSPEASVGQWNIKLLEGAVKLNSTAPAA